MSTSAQISANQANATHSTGPTTEAGKATSSRNALKHGLASGTLIVEGETMAAFLDMKNKLRQEHQPSGITEDFLVEKMAMALWFSRRAQIAQSVAFDIDDLSKLTVLLRYQTTNDRAFYKALTTLRELQKERTKNTLASGIGFVRKSTPEDLWDFAVEQHKKQFPNEPFPDFTPEEKEKLIESLR